MKRLLITAATATILTAGYAMAQDATLTIEPAHRTVIKQYIVKERMKPVRVSNEIAVGTVVPEGVALEPVPDTLVTDVPEVRNYDYFDWNGKVVFVEPQTRKVVQIID